MRALGKAEPTQLPITSLSRHLVTAQEPGVKNTNQAAAGPEYSGPPPAPGQIMPSFPPRAGQPADLQERTQGQICHVDIIRLQLPG